MIHQEILNETIKRFNDKLQIKFVISNDKDYRYAKDFIRSSSKKIRNIVFQPGGS